MEIEEGYRPFAALLAALVVGVLFLIWKGYADAGMAPALLYAALALVGGWWCHTRLGPRSTAAFIVGAAIMVGLLLPFGQLALSPPAG